MGAITLAVMPSSTPGDSRLALDQLCIALTKLLDIPVHGINSASYPDLAAELEKDRVDYAWMSPTLMILTNEKIQLRPLLSAVRDDRTQHQGQRHQRYAAHQRRHGEFRREFQPPDPDRAEDGIVVERDHEAHRLLS